MTSTASSPASNVGNLRRVPTPEERERPGGAGIYYPFDHAGGPRSDKWLNTNPLPKIQEQMNIAYEYEADRIWIVNVGDLKPTEHTDLAARNLNRRQPHLVGVFGSPSTHLAEGINQDLIEGCAEVLHAAGYDVFFELGALNRGAPSWRFDGAILIQAPRPDLVSDLDNRRVPYVCVNERVGNAAANVLADDPAGTRLAVEHFSQLRHTRIAAATSMKLNVPKDISLICFNDVFPVADVYPPITVISVSGRDMGKIGAELLLNNLRTSPTTPPKEIRVTESLIVRGSTKSL